MRRKDFWEYVTLSPMCWEWTGGTRSTGYGAFRVAGRAWSAHRWAYTLSFGPIPDGMLVCHSCDNRLCVRPTHLFLGTHLDNQHDMIRKGRDRKAHGESHCNATLTDEQVRAIRDDQRTQRVIAADYGTTQSHVSDIKNLRKRASA